MTEVCIASRVSWSYVRTITIVDLAREMTVTRIVAPNQSGGFEIEAYAKPDELDFAREKLGMKKKRRRAS